ncbi:MAG: folate-binding protein YgfZ [Alphaproteobacteria bacterium]|nr:folate-binding protein YgfZ [Alphaproteobacteria bacterium]
MSGVLTDRVVIAISGPEAKSFLQGLTTNDINSLTPDVPLYSALLTPQGKVLFDFLLSERDEAIFLDCATSSAQALLKRLTMYRLRAKVDLVLREDLAVCWNGAGGSADPRLTELGTRSVLPANSSDASIEYLSRRLELGVPEGADFGSDKMFALDAGLEELHGVSFEKGCYVGQELTARMKHRGTARKRLLPVSAVDGNDLPSPGTEIRAINVALGEITSTYGTRGFALIRLDRWKEASDAPLLAGEQPVHVTKPTWSAAGLDE